MVDYIHPLPKGTYTVSQLFGTNPSNGNNPAGGHTGTDYAAAEGTPVYAIADGVVESEGFLSGSYLNNAWWLVPEFAGIHAVIDHGNGRPDAVYGHMSATIVNKGQAVKQGQIIGYVGRTGKATGSHLHFEIMPPGYILNGPTYGRVNPGPYLTAHKGDAGVAVRTVTNPVAFARTAPRSDAPLAPGYPEGIAKGATLAVVGYVAGQDPYGKGDNAWYKTPRGYYVWANAAGNSLAGLAKL
jgi:hypothetical protein